MSRVSPAQKAAIRILRTVRPDVYEKHPRAELEEIASREAMQKLQGEMMGLREQLEEYRCPHCGAPLSTRIDAPVDPEERDWDVVATYECGLQSFGGTIRHPCPSDPKFPSLHDYELICEQTSDTSGREWHCYAKPKTDMARKVHLEVAYGTSEAEGDAKLR